VWWLCCDGKKVVYVYFMYFNLFLWNFGYVFVSYDKVFVFEMNFG